MAKCKNGTCWKTYIIYLGNNKRLLVRNITIKKALLAPAYNTAVKIMYQPLNSSYIETLYTDMSGSWGIDGASRFKINREFDRPGTYYVQGFVMTGYDDSQKFDNDYEVIVDYEIISEFGGGKPINDEGNKIPIIGDLQDIWRTLNSAVKIAIILVVVALALYLQIPQKFVKLLKETKGGG